MYQCGGAFVELRYDVKRAHVSIWHVTLWYMTLQCACGGV